MEIGWIEIAISRVYRILIEHNDEFEERFLEERFKIERFDNIRRIIKIECNFEIRSEIFEAILSIKKNFASNRRIGRNIVPNRI